MALNGREVNLPGLRVTLGEPRQVREAVGFCWFPNLDQFASGELLLGAGLTADTNENLADAFSYVISRDKGETWGRPFEVAEYGGGCIARYPARDGALIGPQFYTWPDPVGQWRRFSSHLNHFEANGQFCFRPLGLHVEGLPRDVSPSRWAGKWGRDWPARMVFFGHAIEIGNQEMVTIASIFYQGDSRGTVTALRSTDRGHNWQYLADIAGPETAPESKEGPGEPNLVQLADGDIMCVMRVGSGPGQYLRRSYSSDGGKTWAAVDVLPAYSVAPCLHRLQNGVIALSTGRPGIYLWLSTDPRARSWASIDIVAHHNSWASSKPEHTIVPVMVDDRTERHNKDQTTAYTEIVEISPGRLLMVYDRLAFGWNPVPKDSAERNRIYVLPIQVEQM
ncbi:MAG: exo-alpha-sialidase [Chloroflexi bacterium]|nr:exo-alpha-sialidase [Chloroflexota bacterium]